MFPFLVSFSLFYFLVQETAPFAIANTAGRRRAVNYKKREKNVDFFMYLPISCIYLVYKSKYNNENFNKTLLPNNGEFINYTPEKSNRLEKCG